MYPSLKASDLDIKIFPQYPRRIVISWTIGKSLPVPLRFNVLRSGGLKGEFEKLNTKPIPNFFYFDEGLKPLSKIFDVTYKIEAIWPSGQIQELGIFPLVSSPRVKDSYLVAKEMDHEYEVEYRAYSGINLRIYIRRQFGERCTGCYNLVTEEVTSSDCEECFGTAFKNGYWNPIDSLGKIDLYARGQSIRDPLGFTEDHNSTLHSRNFPILKKGDVVFEKDANILWYVNSVQIIEHGRFPVKNLAEIRQVERSSLLYKLVTND